MNQRSLLHSVLHALRSALVGKSSNITHLTQLPHRPPTRDPDQWRAYWASQGQKWRTEPEIDKERQAYLAQRRLIPPDIEHGIYPFKDIKLDRADVEWLLATLDGRGPVDWGDESQREREGLDVRGADLRRGDLQKLPLARLIGGLKLDEWRDVTQGQRDMAAVHMEEAKFTEAHLVVHSLNA